MHLRAKLQLTFPVLINLQLGRSSEARLMSRTKRLDALTCIALIGYRFVDEGSNLKEPGRFLQGPTGYAYGLFGAGHASNGNAAFGVASQP